MKTRSISHGYYSIIVSTAADRLLNTNNERAFLLAQLQDLLSPRYLAAELPAYKQLSSCIDLLGFSIRSDTIRLVLFSIDKDIALRCVEYALSRLDQYRSEYQPSLAVPHSNTRLTCKKLSGPHHALQETISIHTLHEDWEFDRYSSIGFYVHDRRGDWMRIWRITSLYENSSSRYIDLMRAGANQNSHPEQQPSKLRYLVS